MKAVAMKHIQTRIFRLDGVWQLGFVSPDRQDIRRLSEMRGFRYCGQASQWHITFHVNTVSYLNKRYEGVYRFLPDERDRDQCPSYSSEVVKHYIKILLNELTDRLVVRHSFHAPLYHALRGLDGAAYDRKEKEWLMTSSGHFHSVLQLARKFDIRPDILIDRTGRHEVDPDCKALPEERAIEPVVGGEKGHNFPVLADRFRKELMIRNMSARTIESYHTSIQAFANYFSGRNFQAVSSVEIRDYIFDLGYTKGYSFSSMNQHISAIKAFYKYVFRLDLREIDVPRPKTEKRLPEVLTKEEVRLMIDRCVNLKHRTIIAILYSTAIRRSELIGLKVDDIDLSAGKMRIHGKGKKDRDVFISKRLHDQLERYLRSYGPTEYLFAGQHGGPYSGSSVGKIISGAARRAGIKKRVTPHLLRHSLATHYVSSGISIAHVQKLLGHSDIKTTMIYTHLSDSDLRNLPNPLDEMGI